jgi:two-component system chemotaxis response regulator CheB
VLASSGAILEHGSLYIAPSGLHLLITNNRTLELAEGDPVNFCRPSIDVTMMSVQSSPEAILAGVVMTGMGKDGSEGIRHLKGIGAVTFVQDQASATVFSMPKAAIATGCVDAVLPPRAIKGALAGLFGSMQATEGITAAAEEK